jgi:peptidoglycan hydrolase CwlO-like protein
MKKIINLIALLPLVTLIHAEPQEVQSVIDITPNKPAELGEHRPLSLPTPPAEIKAADVKAVDLKTTTTPNNKAPKKTKKVLTEMSQEEQVVYLKRKIDKLREKSHKTRARIHTLENEVTRLKQELKDLKESKSNNKKGE